MRIQRLLANWYDSSSSTHGGQPLMKVDRVLANHSPAGCLRVKDFTDNRLEPWSGREGMDAPPSEESIIR